MTTYRHRTEHGDTAIAKALGLGEVKQPVRLDCHPQRKTGRRHGRAWGGSKIVQVRTSVMGSHRMASSR